MSANIAMPFVLFGLIATSIFMTSTMYRERARRKRQKTQINHALQKIEMRQNGPSSENISNENRNGTGLDWIGNFAKESGIETLVLRSGLSTGSAVHVWSAIAAGISSGLLVFVLTGRFFLALVAVPLFGALPFLRLVRLGGTRRRQFEEQLPDALDFMAGALRAGIGLTQTFRMIAEEMPSPICEEFRSVNERIVFGVSFQEAVGQMRERVDSRDLDFLVMGLLIQRETGGNISELFLKLANMGRERFKMAGKIRVLSSEGKFSGLLLGAMPFVLAALMTLLSPEYMEPLWYTERGHDLVIMGLCLMAVGFAWMVRMVRMEV